MSFTGTFRNADDVSPAIMIDDGESVTVVLASVLPAFAVVLEEITGSTTEQLASYGASVTTAYTNDAGRQRSVRLRSLGFAASQITYTFGQSNSDVIESWVDDAGVALLTITKSGIQVTGAVDVTGAVTGPATTAGSLAMSTLTSRVTSGGL